MPSKQDTSDHAQGLVSVIIPIYNRANLVGRAISSVISQTYDKVEVICVDDHSTDNSAEVICNFERQYPMRVRYVLNERSKGVSGARNTGIAAARGEFIGFLDSDDRYKEDHILDSVRILHSNPDIDWVFADFERWQGDTKIESSVARSNQKNMEMLISERRQGISIRSGKRLPVRHILYERTPGLGTSIVRRMFCSRILFDESLTMYEDWKYRFDAIKIGGVFGYIDNVHLEVYIHGQNTCASTAYDYAKVIKRCYEFEKVFNGIWKRNDVSRQELRALRRRAASELFWDGGYSLYVNGHTEFAGSLMRKAIAIYPWSPAAAKTFLVYLGRRIQKRFM